MATSGKRPSGHLTGAVIGAVVAAALLGWVLVIARPAEVWELLRSTNAGLLMVALTVSALFLAARGLRLMLLMEPGLVRWPRATVVAAAGQAAALFAPLRTGELALPLMLSRATSRSFSSCVGTLFAARILDLATLGVWGGVAVLAVRGVHEPLPIVLSLALLLPSLLLPFSVSVADRLAVRCFAPRGVRGRRWARRVRRVRYELRALLQRPSRLIGAASASAVMWGLQWTVAWTLLVAMGHHWRPLSVVAGSAAAAVANVLPLNLVGNFGTLEAGWTAAFTALGVPLAVAAATGVAAHLWGLIFAAFYGFLAWMIFSLKSSGT